MGYWQPSWHRNFSFLFCPEAFRQNPKLILDMTKASGSTRPVLIPNPKARLFDQVREVMRFHHYSLRTEKAYLQWIRRYAVFHRRPSPNPSQGGNGKRGWRHPMEMGGSEVREFLTHLAVAGNVAASTQNQAL